MKNYNTNKGGCQEPKILKKLCIKRKTNKAVIEYLEDTKQDKRAENIQSCGTYIGITQIENVTHIVKSNFCRDRLCAICAWRRQSKFIAQTMPILNQIADDYRFLFMTLTIKNCEIEDIKKNIDIILQGFHRLFMRRKFKRVIKGLIRSVEITYNEKENTVHPHMHILAVVDKDYFNNAEDYITHDELMRNWKECCRLNYNPIVDIRRVNDTGAGAVETMKYSLKPTIKDEALRAFDMLKGKRLISFTGIIRELRAQMKYSGIEEINTYDDVQNHVKIKYDLYKFDVNAGLYKYLNTFDI